MLIMLTYVLFFMAYVLLCMIRGEKRLLLLRLRQVNIAVNCLSTDFSNQKGVKV